MPDVGDDPVDDGGLPAGIGQDVGGDEVLGEHVRLELQRGVQYPEQSQHDLQRALRAHEPITGVRRRLGVRGVCVYVGIVFHGCGPP
jgi:hypothetical protein